MSCLIPLRQPRSRSCFERHLQMHSKPFPIFWPEYELKMELTFETSPSGGQGFGPQLEASLLGLP